MIWWAVILTVFSCKAVCAVTFASEVNRRFAKVPDTWEWRFAWLCCNGQILAALLLAWLQIRPNVPSEARAVGAVAFVAGHSLHLAAMAVNRHFRPEIVKPPERCQHWLYKLRHPGYLGLWLASFGQTALLGFGILAPCFFGYAALLIYRTIQEERLLCPLTREN
jgi:protein-S-isoprenylcysteine O-methyltransferase Ste14